LAVDYSIAGPIERDIDGNRNLDPAIPKHHNFQGTLKSLSQRTRFRKLERLNSINFREKMSSISKVVPIIDPTRGEDAWAAWDEAKGRQAFPKGNQKDFELGLPKWNLLTEILEHLS